MRPSPVSPLRIVAHGEAIEVLDQTRLPHACVEVLLDSGEAVAEAIGTMVIRGAPLIGAVAAWGLAFALKEDAGDDALDTWCKRLKATRPTAVNLVWALERMQRLLLPLRPHERYAAARAEAKAISEEDVAQNLALGEHGLHLIKSLSKGRSRPLRVLTHCNAGALATVGWGTALAPLYLAHQEGIPIFVWVDETRPRNQGALTAWELERAKVPHTLIVDNAGGHLMQRGEVDLVIVGADRVSQRGDVCNKIGTYLKALAARDNGIPFYAAVPTPTIDLGIQNALKEIPIEERAGEEVSHIRGRSSSGSIDLVQLTSPGVPVANPAFDITPAELITGILTEKGLVPATEAGIASLFL